MKSVHLLAGAGSQIGTLEDHRVFERETIFIVLAGNNDLLVDYAVREIGDFIGPNLKGHDYWSIGLALGTELAKPEYQRHFRPEEKTLVRLIKAVTRDVGSIAIGEVIAEVDAETSILKSLRIEAREGARARSIKYGQDVPIRDLDIDDLVSKIEAKF